MRAPSEYRRLELSYQLWKHHTRVPAATERGVSADDYGIQPGNLADCLTHFAICASLNSSSS
jgi:hypothetical protein